MIDRYRQVVRTYVPRKRFWVAGAAFLVASLNWNRHPSEYLWWALSSTFLASIVGCFLALHVRRQFSGASAKMWPDFTAPHLAVAAVLSAVLWIVVPWTEAGIVGLPPYGMIAIYSLAGTFTALVVCWRQAIFLVTVLPFLALSLVPHFRTQQAVANWLEGVMNGENTSGAASLIVAAALAHVAAAVVLLRLSDRMSPLSDDFLAEMPRTDRVTGRAEELLLGLRDSAVRHRLADVGRAGWTVNRWRLPVALPPMHFALAAAATLLLMGLAWLVSGEREGIGVGVAVGIPVMLIMPFSMWHQRRGLLGSELLRPVARGQFFRQMAAAMAIDVFSWALLAAAFGSLALGAFARDPREGLRIVGWQVAIMGAVAVWMYGVAVMTYRFRYWIPIMVGMALAWCFVVVPIVAIYAKAQPAHPFAATPAPFCILTAACGLLLTWRSYAYWCNADLA